MGKKRTKPFEIRNGQFWAAGDDTKKPKFVLGHVEKTTRGGEVVVRDELAKTPTTVTISKATLLEQYKYIPARGAEVIAERFAIVAADKTPNAREPLAVAKEVARTIAAIHTPPGKQADLPFESHAAPVVGPAKKPPAAVMPTPPKKDVVQQAIDALGPAAKPADPFKKTLSPVEHSLVTRVKSFLETCLKAAKIALGEV